MRPLLLAIDSAGFPARWLTWQDAIVHDVLGKFSYGFGDFEFSFRGGKNRKTGLDSRISLRSILVLKGRTPESCKHATIALSNESLFRRDRNMCAYCGKVGAKLLTRDHIKPLCRGGEDTWHNCCACCASCNAAKGSHTLDELGWELLYVPYAPSHQEGLILQNRQILADQMELLRTMLPRDSRLWNSTSPGPTLAESGPPTSTA